MGSQLLREGGASVCWSSRQGMKSLQHGCLPAMPAPRSLQPRSLSLSRPRLAPAFVVSGRQLQQPNMQAPAGVSVSTSGDTEFLSGSWDSTCQSSACSSSSMDTPPGRNRPCSIGRILQGAASVRGLLKKENQDRLLALANLHPAIPGMAITSCFEEDVAQAGSTQQETRQQHSMQEGSQVPELYLSAVFDGHGGSKSSSHAAWRMQQIIQGEPALLAAITEPTDAAGHVGCDNRHMDIQHLWSKVFGSMDREILDQSRASGQIDGTTALAGVHQGASLMVANAGDCRAVLGRGGNALRLTCDHHPGVGTERRRIEAVGGVVRHLKGSWRILLPNPDNTEIKICATSRGLGDLDFKTMRLISCEPEITEVTLVPHVDLFSIFASDGIWSYVEDQDAVNAVTSVLDQFSRMSKPDLQVAANAAAQALVKLALNKGSVDDMTVIVHVYDWTSRI